MKKDNKKEIEELKKKNEELENQLKRVLADYQNLEKRATEERKEWIKGANQELILRLLPILDTLMLAQKHVKDQGMDLSINQFLAILKNEGVEPIEAVNQDFNPELMECVSTVEAETGKVVAETRKGYTLNGQVLRVAQVTVGKKTQETKEEALAQEERQRGDYL